MTNHARLIDILRKLVSFQTVATNFEEVERNLQFIENCVRPCSVFTDRYVSNGFQSLVISTKETKAPKLILQAHIDVVPGYDHQFSLQQHEGKLYGRGVYDMKFAAACFIYLLEDLKDELSNLNIAVMITADEEVDGHNGVEYLLNQGYTASACLLPDSGENWNIELEAKGFAVAKLYTQGKSAHGSRPWEAENAATKLINCAKAIESKFALKDRHGLTVNLTMLHAGSAHNQIPGEATATYDIRFPNETVYRQCKSVLTKICANYGTTVVFTPLAVSVRHDTETDHMQIWKAATTKITKHVPEFTRSFAASDARYFVPFGIPTISTRPKGGGHHSGDEWLEENDFYRFYEVVKLFVRQVGSS